MRRGLSRSSTAQCRSLTAARIVAAHLSIDLRGIITVIPAWSASHIMRAAPGKIACFQSSLVCTSQRNSMFNVSWSSGHEVATNLPRSCVSSEQLVLADDGPRAINSAA